jgi:intein/homing endonuclease/phage terminase large subunit-like protein
MLRGFTEAYLLSGYDNPKPVPQLHWDMWDECCSDSPWVALAAPREHAKCCSGETLVSMADGTRRQLADVAVGDAVVCVDKDHRTTVSRVSKKWDSGRKDCLTIRTRSNRTITVTPEHRLFEFDGWTTANELSAGDYLASPRKLPQINDTLRSDEEVRFVAYMIAEGALSSGNCKFTNFDAAIVRDMKNICRAMGFAFRRGKRGQYSLSRARPYLRRQRLYGHTALTKRLPDWVYLLPDRQKWMFVAALWDTDGWFATQSGRAGITLANEPLIDDIRELLLRIGVPCTKNIRPNDCAGAWQITVLNTCLEAFINDLPLLAKRDKADALLGKDRYSQIDIYPNRIKKARVNVEREFRAAKVARVDNSYEITRGKLARMIEYETVPEWVQAENADIFWDKVVSIEPAGSVDTYDIDVWGQHNFIGDGIVSHNSTCITHAYGLLMSLAGFANYTLLVSDTEEQACEFLGDIAKELRENDALRRDFGVKKLLKDTEANLICLMADGRQFRILAKGSEQKVRGRKWRGQRPDLILIDDAENDESVMNPDRRKKFRDWFFKALIPCGSDTCRVRMVGTILHLDSMLNRLMENSSWRTRLWAAHGPDFSNILWPEKFSKERLERIRNSFKEDGDLAGYSTEYLNNPVDEQNQYFRTQDFVAMDKPDYEAPKVYVAAADFAISESEQADYFVIMVAGIDPNGRLHVVDVRRFRGADETDARDIINELLSVQERYDPEIFTFERGQIEKSIEPFLNTAMMNGTWDSEGNRLHRAGLYINIEKVVPSKSKTIRGRSIKAKMKAGGVRFDMDADWYPDLEAELRTITERGPKGKHDDQFDTFAYIGLTIDQHQHALSAEEQEEEEQDEEFLLFGDTGQCAVTGY